MKRLITLAKKGLTVVKKNEPVKYPELQYAYIEKDYIITSDTHKALAIKHQTTVAVPYVYSYQDNRELTAENVKVKTFESVLRLINQEEKNAYNPSPSLLLGYDELKYWVEVLDRCKVMDSRRSIARASFTGNLDFYSDNVSSKDPNKPLAYEEMIYYYDYLKAKQNHLEDGFELWLDPIKLLNLLQVFKQLRSEKLEIYVKGKFNPMFLRDNQGHLALLSPIRTTYAKKPKEGDHV